MSTASSTVSAVSSTSSGSTGWVVPAGYVGSDFPLDPVSGVGFSNVNDNGSGAGNWDSRGQRQFSAPARRQAPFFTPLVGRQAMAFAAIEGTGEGRFAQVLYLSDLQYAASVYEFSMRLTSDVMTLQGSLVNRFS